MAGLIDISLGNFTEIAIGELGSKLAGDLEVVACVQSVGDISDEATITDVSCYGQKYLRKLVGSANASAIEVVVNYNPSDLQQIELFAAYNDSTAIAVAIIMNESAPSVVTGDQVEGTHIIFSALVASASVSNAFDETRTVTFSFVPTKGVVDLDGSDGYQPNPIPTT